MISRSPSRSSSRSWFCSSGIAFRSCSWPSARRSRCISPACSIWPESLGGLGDPAVIFIASLFVVSAGLDATGVTAWAGQGLIAQAGQSRVRLLVLMMTLVALLTALISVNGAVAALLPVVVVMAIRLGRAPSQLLMPLVFSAHSGSLLALTGTPVNVLVSEAATDAGLPPFGFFSFAIAGIPLVVGTILIVVLFGQRLLPERSGRTLPPDLSKHARTLVEQYRLDDGLFQLRVRARSPYVGAPPVRRRPDRLRGADPGRHPGRRRQRPASAPHARRGRYPHRAGRRGNRRRSGVRQAARLPDGGRADGRRGDAVQPQLRPGRGRDPAAFRHDRAVGVSRDGHAERRPGHPRGAAQGRGSGSGRNHTGRRRHAAAPGDLAGARQAPRRSRRAGRRLAGTRSSAGGSHGRGGEVGDRRAARHGGPARDRRGAVGHRRPGRRLRDGAAARGHGRTGLPLDQLDDGDPGRRHDPAVDRHVQERCGEPHGGDRWCIWSATPVLMHCSPGCSC